MTYLVEIVVDFQGGQIGYTSLVYKKSDVDKEIEDMYDDIVSEGYEEECIEGIIVYDVSKHRHVPIESHRERIRIREEESDKLDKEEDERRDKQLYERLKKRFEG